MATVLPIALDVLQNFILVLPKLFFHPLFYLTVAWVFVRNIRLVRQERQMFHVALHVPVVRSVKMLLVGIVAGLVSSLLLLALGVVIHREDAFLLWVIVLLTYLFGRRKGRPLFLSIGLMGLFLLLIRMTPLAKVFSETQALRIIWPALAQLDLAPWLAVAGFLMLTEAFLLRQRPERNAFAFIERGARGGWIGGYRVECWWPLPLFLLMPVPTGAVGAWDGWPFWGQGELTFQVIPVPVFLGLAFSSVKLTAAEVARAAFRWRLTGGIVLLVLGYVSRESFWFQGLGVAVLLLVEVALWGGLRWAEEQRKAPFLPDVRGLKVLAVVPDSPAEEMGILPGEVVVRSNGLAVVDAHSLYQALQQNPAYCRLEVLDKAGELRILQRAVYEGEHHQLGLVVVPRQGEPG